MDEKDAVAGERSVGIVKGLRLSLAIAGLLALAWLVLAPSGDWIGRGAACGVAALSIVALAWRHRQLAGETSREAEIFARQIVEDKRDLEARLARSEEFHQTMEHYFETLMDHIPSNIYFKDRESRFLKVNQNMAESFSCGHPSDLTGKTDHDFFGPEHADQALADEQKILSSGKGITDIVEHETFTDGKEGWVLTTKMPFRDRTGKIIGTFGMSSNVTELVVTRNQLERERNILRSLIDSFPDPIFVRDPGGSYLVVNKAMAELSGAKAPEEMLGRKQEDFFAEDVVKRGAMEDLDLLASGKPVLDHEWILDRPSGGRRILITTKVPLLDAEGRSWGIVGMHRDVTEQRRAKEQLIESELRLQEFMDNSPAVIYIKDLDGRYQMINSGFEEMFGLSREDVLGRTDHDFLADKLAADKFRKNDLQVIEHAKPLQTDEELYVAGEPRWYVSARFPLRDVHGRVRAVGGISTDITDRKAAEESMRKLNAELVRANENVQRAQEQLIQAEKMESIGRLASGVAHEVKNPLAMIGMGLELLARRVPEDDEGGREAVERMKRAIERAKKIVKGLVDFSSARQLALEEGQVNEVVRDSLALVDYQLRQAGVKVVEEFAGDLPPVKLDVTKLEQVLVNLMINAMHAMDHREGERTLTLRTRQSVLAEVRRDEGVRTTQHLRSADRVVIIEVDDTGPGIDPVNLKKLFDPFFTTKATGVGTGLGLSVSRKIIELHHGTLELTNRPEGGVRATVTLKV